MSNHITQLASRDSEQATSTKALNSSIDGFISQTASLTVSHLWFV